jgi:murein tripeptide amidase MpaA
VSVTPEDHFLVHWVIDHLVSEGALQVLTFSGHEGFIIGYKINLLVSNITHFFSEDVHFGLFETLREEGAVGVQDLSAMIRYRGKVVPPTPRPQQSDEQFSFQSYHTQTSMRRHLEDLQLQYSDILELFELDGETYEGRKIWGVRITNDVASEVSRDKPVIYLEGGVHSREWISPSTMIYLIEGLIGLKEQDKSTQTAVLRDTLQFILIPVSNPDGYEYSKINRMWRKTRKPSGCKFNLRDCNGDCLLEVCYGVDPNRNWDIDFGAKGGSSEPCDDSFPGTEPFDQNCVVMIRDFLTAHREKLVLSISYHSYSQLFLYPWGYSKDPTRHYERHKKVGDAFSRAVAARHGVRYRHHPISHIFHDRFPKLWYEVSGTSIDWLYREFGLVDSYGVELRDHGWYQFLLPTNQILPTGEENFDGLLAVIQSIIHLGPQ